MRKYVFQALSVALLSGAALAQGVVTSTMNNTLNDPFNLSPGLNGMGVLAPNPIINQDSSGTPIDRIEQIELRHIGGNQYYVTLTAVLVGSSDTSMVSGTLTLTGQGTGTWAADNAFTNLNQTNTSTDEFQCSMTANRLICVWDNYQTATYASSAGAQTGESFICTRTNANTPFAVADVRVIGGGIGNSGGVDPHIAQDNVGNGNILLHFIDFAGLNPQMDIRSAEVNPATGAASNVQPVVSTLGSGAVAGTFTFLHSPQAQRDSTGAPRGITISEFDSGVGGGSHGYWNSNVNDAGNISLIGDQRFSSTGGFAWLANPFVVGGTHGWATAEGGYQRLTVFEGIEILDTNSRNGERVVMAAPMRPGYPNGYTDSMGNPCPGGIPFISGWLINASGAGASIMHPVVSGLLIPPDAVVTLFLHDVNTGYAEINLGTTNFGINATMQAVTIDICNSAFIASNVAQFQL